MELLRVPPFPLTIDYSGLPNDTAVVLTLSTSRNKLLDNVEATTNGSGVASFELPVRYSMYDGEYSAIVYEGTTSSKGNVVLLDTLRVVRPYVDSAAMAPVGEEAAYTKYERIARTMIDNIVGGFYYKNAVIDLQGDGSDRLPVGHRVNKLLRLVENNVVMYEQDGESNAAEYTLTSDHSSIILFKDEESNMLEGHYSPPGLASSDSFGWPYNRAVAFPSGYDYEVTFEAGWPMVPQDIKEATTLIIEDMACGEPNYWSKYVREYETKDYRVDFHRSMFAGTGNVIVDQILQRYFGDTLYNNIRIL